MKKTYLTLVLLLLGIALFGSGGQNPYPDGPFKVLLHFQGFTLMTDNQLTLHSETVVVENKMAMGYTKSPGVTTYSDFSVALPAADANLDTWFNPGNSAQKEDFLLEVLNGQNNVIETWRVKNALPLQRQTQPDGTIKYTFRAESFERD